MDEAERSLKELGSGWCLQYTDVPLGTEVVDKFMWTCFLMAGHYQGTFTEGVDWFMAPSPLKVLELAVKRRELVDEERTVVKEACSA